MKIYALKVLFVCSRNKRRSLTAETIFRGKPEIEVRSAGTQPGSRRIVSEGMLRWADIVIAMEKSHVRRLEERYPHLIREKEVVPLHVTDDYEYMQPELIDELQGKVDRLLVERERNSE